MKSVMIIGGPGNISESTVRYFLKKKMPVATLTHATTDLMGMEGEITAFRGERNNEEDILKACEAFHPEVIIDFCCFEPEQARTMIGALKKTDCRRFIFVSTVDVYGYPLSNLPMREKDPWNKPRGSYAEKKLECEKIFAEGFREGTPFLTIARPAYSMGKGFALSAFERNRGKHIVQRIRKGEPIFVPGEGELLLQTGSAYNTGLMIARIAEDDRCIGEDYTCGHPTFNTHDEYVQAFAKVLGKPARLVHIPTDFMYSLGRQEVTDSILDDLTMHNIYFSVEKFREVFPDFVWEYTMEDAARDFIEHQQRKGTFDREWEDQFEDRLIEKWEEAMENLRKSIDF